MTTQPQKPNQSGRVLLKDSYKGPELPVPFQVALNAPSLQGFCSIAETPFHYLHTL